MRVSLRQGTVGNSHANGQAEVMIRMFRVVIRKYLAMYPTMFWSDVVPYAL